MRKTRLMGPPAKYSSEVAYAGDARGVSARWTSLPGETSYKRPFALLFRAVREGKLDHRGMACFEFFICVNDA